MYAWQELSPAEENGVWDRFQASFGFAPRVGGQATIREPTPSLTWSIAHVFGDQRDWLEDDLHIRVLDAFRRCLPRDGKLYALDWQHPCYWLWPHRVVDASRWDAWKVPVLPDGDYYVFLAEDFCFGLFGHPWEQTLCAFGRPLLDALSVNRPTLLTTPLRRNGLPTTT